MHERKMTTFTIFPLFNQVKTGNDFAYYLLWLSQPLLPPSQQNEWIILYAKERKKSLRESRRRVSSSKNSNFHSKESRSQAILIAFSPFLFLTLFPFYAICFAAGMVWWQFIDITATTPDQITISYASIHTVPAYSVVLVLMLHIIMKKVTWQRKEGGNWKKKLVGWYCWRKRTLGPFKMEEEENERDFFLSSFFFHIFWCDDVKEIKKTI